MSEPRNEDSSLHPVDAAGHDAAILSAVEMGLGSVLHSFHVPMSGQFLSLNQGLILSRGALRTRHHPASRYHGATVSNIAAAMKSLSPAGKRLTPMLAISAQGLLFSLGTLLFGVNLFGILVGMALMSVWAFAQPFLLYYVLFGETLIYMAEYYLRKLSAVAAFDPADLLYVLLGAVALKVLLALAVGVASWRMGDSALLRYQERMLRAGRRKRRGFVHGMDTEAQVSKLRLALRDLFNPLFVVSLALTGVFFAFARDDAVATVWALLRPLAVGFILFYLIRLVSFERLFARMQRSRFHRFGRAFQTAVRTLQEL